CHDAVTVSEKDRKSRNDVREEIEERVTHLINLSNAEIHLANYVMGVDRVTIEEHLKNASQSAEEAIGWMEKHSSQGASLYAAWAYEAVGDATEDLTWVPLFKQLVFVDELSDDEFAKLVHHYEDAEAAFTDARKRDNGDRDLVYLTDLARCRVKLAELL